MTSARAAGARARSTRRARTSSLSVGVAAMAALIAALFIWRTDVVRVLPQTAALFKLAGINVNLRNLTIEDVHVSTETVNGAPVTVIEGAVAATGFKPIEIPRLRFIVRDAVAEPRSMPGTPCWNRPP